MKFSRDDIAQPPTTPERQAHIRYFLNHYVVVHNGFHEGLKWTPCCDDCTLDPLSCPMLPQ
jgi:hypothetical protein